MYLPKDNVETFIMRNTSKVAKHQFYNLFQNLKMSPIRTMDDLQNIPPIAGAFIFWIDEAPPVCLFTGIASPKLEDGLKERIAQLLDTQNTKSDLQSLLAKDTNLGRTYKLDLKKPENRERFFYEHTYFQYLTIPDMKEDELLTFQDFLEERSELNPHFKKDSTRPKRKGK